MCKGYFPSISSYRLLVGFAVFATAISMNFVARSQNRAAIGCAPIRVNADSPPVSFESIACSCFNKCDVTPAPPLPNTDRTPPDTRKFRLLEGRDVDGHDYETLRGVHYEQCVSACKADRRCSSFSFDKWNKWCYLKDTIPSEIRIEPSSLVAVSSNANPSVSRSLTRMEKFKNARFYDEPFQRISNSSWDKCVNSCDADNKCEVFTFEKSSNVCKLIATPSEYFRKPNIEADSGVKRQLPMTASAPLGAAIRR
jgi:hypothetical protein